jgi:hypothetical protein
MITLRRTGLGMLLVLLLYALSPVQIVSAQTVPSSGFHNNNSPNVVYVGSWTYSAAPVYGGAANGDVHRTTVNGSYVEFRFIGSRVTYWYSQTANSGRYTVVGVSKSGYAHRYCITL